MRKLLFIITLATLFTSCSRTRDEIHAVDVVANGYKPGPTIQDEPVQILDTNYRVKLTMSQAGSYASKRGDNAIWVVLGIVFILAFFYVLIGYAKNWPIIVNLKGSTVNILLGICVAASIGSFKWRQLDVWLNNDRWIHKTEYDSRIKMDGSLNKYWDSLANGCHLTGGPYKCYQK